MFYEGLLKVFTLSVNGNGIHVSEMCDLNQIGENKRCNLEWTIQGCMIHKTQDDNKTKIHNTENLKMTSCFWGRVPICRVECITPPPLLT